MSQRHPNPDARQTIVSVVGTFAILWAAACTDPPPHPQRKDGALDYTLPGPHAVAVQRYPATERHPPFLLFGPSRTPPDSYSLAALELDPERASQMARWVSDAPPGCPTRALEGTVDGPIDGTELPVVIISHCYACTASSLATVASHLATWGVAVVAISHEGNTLYDAASGNGAALDTATLELRVGQLDAWLASGPSGVDASLHPTDRVTVGHSFGVVTTGMLAQRDASPLGAVFIGAPAENPLIPGVSAAALTLPTVWVLLEEDNSIGAIGNQLLEDNVEQVSGPTRLVRIPDAGHWSVSDIVGVDASTMPGCGNDTRQDGSDDAFSYPPAAAARGTTAEIVATAVLPWFDGHSDTDSIDVLNGWNGIVVESQ